MAAGAINMGRTGAEAAIPRIAVALAKKRTKSHNKKRVPQFGYIPATQ
jgi:hypothetical protein